RGRAPRSRSVPRTSTPSRSAVISTPASTGSYILAGSSRTRSASVPASCEVVAVRSMTATVRPTPDSLDAARSRPASRQRATPFIWWWCSSHASTHSFGCMSLNRRALLIAGGALAAGAVGTMLPGIAFADGTDGTEQTITVTGRFEPGAPDWYYLPVEVPRGVAELTV